MSKRIGLIIFLFLFSTSVFCVYWLRIGFENIILRESLYLFTSLFGTIAGIFALTKFGFKNERSMTFIFLTAGMGYWFLGEIIFNYYQYILNIDPFPSIADVFYLLAYPFLLIGLLNEIRISRVNWQLVHKPTIFLSSIIAVLLTAIVSYFGIYQSYNSTETFWANFINMSYGAGDVLLILASMIMLVLAWEFRGGRLSRVWMILFLSFSSTLVADIIFAIYSDQYEMQVWFYKSLPDSFWMISYLLFALALFEFGFSIQSAYQKIKDLKQIKPEIEDNQKINLELDQAKDEFISSISHELRTPMGAVKGLVSMMLKGDYGQVPEKFRQPLTNVAVSAERQIHLINNLLNISRLQLNRVRFTLSDFSLGKVVSEVIEALQSIVQQKKIILKIEGEIDSLIQADDIWTKQIFENIIGNAVKFTSKGEVIISYSQQGDLAMVLVSDSGPGISLEDQDKLFGKFEQPATPILNKTTGSGLGLYISREIARKMGGDVSLIRSEIGKGSIFAVSFPKSNSQLAQETKIQLEKENALTLNINKDK